MIIIPERFKKKLEQNGDHIQALTLASKSNFKQIYSENNLYFFNEYTDHGYRHINCVLNAIDDLITENSWKLLSDKDVLIIIISTFLHDLGMHLQPLTFKALIEGEYDDLTSFHFNDQKWSSLWADYIDEAKKWSDDEVMNIFGSSLYEVEMPDLDRIESFGDNQKKLIGEFIRRHHPRIAFEIAFRGLKSNTGTFIDLCPGLNDDFRFLAGLVARSHGMHVRDTFEILQKRYLVIWKMPQNIYVIYLMVLLRIGDYFQIDESRIFTIPFQTKLFRSPISMLEHEKHFSISGYQQLIDDPETLYFNALPTSSRLYVALKNLFFAIQNEIDTSWGILGEIYGTLKLQIRPAIKYRRIKSSLDDPFFSLNLPYIPELFSFTADKELLRLLIAPLYGYNPSFGIRELLQNSIDACVERKKIEELNNIHYSGKIEINFHMNSNSRTIFSIKDNGKGMSASEIKNYFLRAGSSLKKSNEWKKLFVQQNKTPTIHRIGKFGIGVLAAYLLGNEIYVETRKYTSEIGYYFKAKIDDSHIEIIKRDNLPIGTTVTIFVADDIRNNLLKHIHDRLKGGDADSKVYEPNRWDKWYTLKEPCIKMKVYNFPEFAPYKQPNPSFNETLPDGWKSFQTVEFEKVAWTYNQNFANASLTCNGIVIPNGYDFNLRKGINAVIRKPKVSVYDFKGNLKLDLNRNSLVEKELPFEDELVNSIFQDLLSQALMFEVNVTDMILQVGSNFNGLFEYPGLTDKLQVFFLASGFYINLPFLNGPIRNTAVFNLVFNPNELANYGPAQIKLNDQPITVRIESLTKALYSDQGEIEVADPKYSSKVESNKFVKENIHEICKFKFGVKHSTRGVNPIENFENGLSRFTYLCKQIMGRDTLIPYSNDDRRVKFKKAFSYLGI